MRRAEWRRRADDPTTLLGWWGRGIVDFHDPRERRFLAFALLPFLVCGLVRLAGGGWGWLALAGANLLFTNGQRRKEESRLSALLPEPAPKGQFRAAVAYRTKGLRTGTDEMALTVVDGWLYAEGVRSHFALRPEDVERLTSGPDRRGWLKLSDGSAIELQGLSDSARIDLERWHQANLFGGGESTFPPARVHLQELARRAAWMLVPPLIFSLMAAARPIRTESLYYASLFGIFTLFVTTYAWSHINFFQLVQIEDRAKEEEQEALAGQAPPLQEENSEA